MGTKTYNNYEDLITFTRASGGHALRPVSYGSQLITNGTFDSDLSGWTTGSNVTSAYSSGTAQLTLGGALTSTSLNWFSQTVFEVGKIYFVTFDATYVSGGSLQAGYGFDLEVTATSSGTYSFTVDPTVGLGTQTNRNNITFGGTSGAVWKIDNVSVKEVTFDEPDGTLTLFEHPDNIPRVEYDADGNRLGLLIELARTNLIPRSDVDDWTNASGGTTSPVTETTLGAFTGKTVISQGQAWHRATSPPFSATSGTTYTVTAFYKAGTSGQVYIDFRIPTDSSVIKGNAGSLYASSNAAGTATILSQETLPQGVYKVVFTVVANATASNCIVGIGPNSTTSGETVIALAAQVEQASFGTSYIKTTGSTATRSTDVATMSFDNFGHNKKELTLLVDFDYSNWQNSSSYHRAVSLGRSTTSTNANFGVFNNGASSGTLRYRVDNSSGTAVFSAGDLTGSDGVTSAKVALAVKEGQHAITYNGNTPNTSTGGDPELETVDILAIGARWAESPQNAADYGQCHIKSIKYYPRRLTNAQLQEITS